MASGLTIALCQINLFRYKAIKFDHQSFGMGEEALGQGCAIVVDFGKTHAKLTLWSRDGQLLDRVSRTNVPQGPAPYMTLDLVGIADWLIASLLQFSGQPVEAIIPVAHGAAVAGIRKGVLAFVPPDYEWPIPDEVLEAYRAGRDPFAVTGSPAFPGGLNIGSQLHYLEAQDPALFGEATLLPYAQYWAWLLSGVAVSEVTSLGCHSDLWDPASRDFSPMARRRGWAQQFAPLAKAGDVIGNLQPDLAALTGLSPNVRIHAGLHDSNAALVAARGFAELGGQEATVLSTGTWFVAMRTPAQPVALAALPEARDCLVNVDVDGNAVPSARWMGGREIELLDARIDVPGLCGLAEVLASGSMVLPSLVQGSGPFPDANHRWVKEPSAAPDRAAAVALYAALMADCQLGLIGAKERLLIEGRFARSEIFTRALASLRPETRIYVADAEADVSFGALRLIWNDLRPKSLLQTIEPLPHDLAAYGREWRARAAEQGR